MYSYSSFVFVIYTANSHLVRSSCKHTLYFTSDQYRAAFSHEFPLHYVPDIKVTRCYSFSQVDATEKTVLQYRSDIDRSDEKLKEIEKANESETAKLDTELLYVGYMVEKKFQNDNNGEGEDDLSKTLSIIISRPMLKFQSAIISI